MAEIRLEPAPILGVDHEVDGVRVRERSDLALVSVAVPLRGDTALEQALQSAWDLPRPEPTLFSQSGDMRAVQAAPDQMLLIFPQGAPDARAEVDARLGGTGYTTDQTDVWVVLELEGATVRAALERMCLLDVQGFTPGFAARTVMEHMSAWVICLGPDRFWLMSASSSAGSFLHAVETSCRNVTVRG